MSTSPPASPISEKSAGSPISPTKSEHSRELAAATTGLKTAGKVLNSKETKEADKQLRDLSNDNQSAHSSNSSAPSV